jgi:hypothetical protein
VPKSFNEEKSQQVTKIMSCIGLAKLVNNSEGSPGINRQFSSLAYPISAQQHRAKYEISTNVGVQNTPQFHKAVKT